MNTSELEVQNDLADGRRSKSQRGVSQLVIASIMLTIALMLKGISELIPFFNWPAGGSISLAMVPLILVSLYCGPIYGTVVGVTFGIIDFFWDGVLSWTSNPLALTLCMILDYVIGFGVVGLGAIFRKRFFEKRMWAPIAAISLSGFLRLLSSFFSGVIVFTNAFDYASTTGLAIDFTPEGIAYSLGYNGGYMLPTIAISIAVLAVLIKPLFAVMDLPVVKNLAPKTLREEEMSKFVIPSFEKLVPIYLVVVYSFAVISMVTPFYLAWFGYISGAISLGFIAFEGYLMIKETKEKNTMDMIFTSIFLVLSLIGLVLSIIGILSPFTYASEDYTKHFTEETVDLLLLK